MQRDSSLHSPRQDDALKKEMQGMLKANRSTRAHPGLDVEPAPDDDAAHETPEFEGTEGAR